MRLEGHGANLVEEQPDGAGGLGDLAHRGRGLRRLEGGDAAFRQQRDGLGDRRLAEVAIAERRG